MMEQEIYIEMGISAVILGIVRCALFLFYVPLFFHLRWMRITLLIGFILGILSYITISMIVCEMTGPLLVEYLLKGTQPWHILHLLQFSVPTAVLGMLVDWYLFVIAIPAVWTLKMSLGKKVGVIIIFMTGGL